MYSMVVSGVSWIRLGQFSRIPCEQFFFKSSLEIVILWKTYVALGQFDLALTVVLPLVATQRAADFRNVDRLDPNLPSNQNYRWRKDRVDSSLLVSTKKLKSSEVEEYSSCLFAKKKKNFKPYDTKFFLTLASFSEESASVTHFNFYTFFVPIVKSGVVNLFAQTFFFFFQTIVLTKVTCNFLFITTNN